MAINRLRISGCLVHPPGVLGLHVMLGCWRYDQGIIGYVDWSGGGSIQPCGPEAAFDSAQRNWVSTREIFVPQLKRHRISFYELARGEKGMKLWQTAQRRTTTSHYALRSAAAHKAEWPSRSLSLSRARRMKLE